MLSKFGPCALALIALVAGCAEGEDNPASDAGATALGGSAGKAGAAGSAGGAGTAAGGSGTGGTGGSSAGGSAGTGGEPPNCHVVVNEVMTASTTSDNDEFVEIFNPCSSSVQVPGWRLFYRSAAGTTDVTLYAFTAGSIDPGEYWIIAGTEWSGASAKGTFASGSLSATGGGVALTNGTDVVDMVGWGTATNDYVEGSPPAGPGPDSSLARSPNGKDSDDNFVDFKMLDSPSPGGANP